MKIKFIDSILKIESKQLDELGCSSYPFLKHAFLSALETSGCVSMDSGWQIKHVTAWDGDELVGFMPLYIKSHSYGEYVFDFQWANAYHQSGLDYYPKFLCAIPFTPCTGPRLIIKNRNLEPIKKMMIEKILEESKVSKLSSFHYLFLDAKSEPSTHLKTESQLLKRVGMQYHWFNQNYTSFENFLERCKAKSRKNIKRERKSFINSEITIQKKEGEQITESLWKQFYLFYCATYAKRSGNYGYLNESFFQMIGKTMPNDIVMIVAKKNSQPIAISLFFKGENTLYGRYWGCSQEVEFLHFELCYYQGIDYCIKNGLQRFDAGAQGEHKISRGFKPIETVSYHWINDIRFREAIKSFLAQEMPYVVESIDQLSQKLPFKNH